MDKLPDHITTDLLSKYLAGECETAETEIVELWKNESSQSREVFQQYEMLWKDMGVLSDSAPRLSVDVDAAWEKLKTVKQESMVDVQVTSGTWMRIAASIVVVLGIFALINKLTKQPTMVLAQTTIDQSTVYLPDESVVKLNANSEIRYPDQFVDDSRQVMLVGEAYFQVAHNATKPFEVNIGQAKVTVLGTTFNIKSSPSFDTVSVFVSTGKVRFALGDQELILTKGEKGILYANAGMLAKFAPASAGLDEFWRTKSLHFNGEKLPEVASVLSQAYGQSIVLANEQIEDCRLAASFENDSLENILEVIALTLQLEIENKNQTILLRGTGCEVP